MSQGATMSNTYQFQVIFKHENGTAKDQYVNNWHFDRPTPDAGVTDYDNVRDMLKDFYTVGDTNAIPLTYHMPAAMLGTATVKGYDLSEPKPRPPVYESSFTFPRPQSPSLPFEVACCFSFEAERQAGKVQRRRRNRVYLGPLNTITLDPAGKVNLAYRNLVLHRGKNLKTSADASVNWDWVVFSPTDSESHAVDTIYINDAFDTQRRRGLPVTAKTLWQF
jgi:hypothetical protein